MSDTAWSESTISYSFPTDVTHFSYSNRLTGNQNEVEAAQKVSIYFALDEGRGDPDAAGFSVEGFTNLSIDFDATPDSTNKEEIRVSDTSAPKSAIGTAQVSDFPGNYLTSTQDDNGDVWFGRHSGATGSYDDPEAGNFAWHTHLHEIGHALGLTHGHTTDGYSALPSATDSMEYSIMTYRSYVGHDPDFYTNETWGYAQTYMMSDIAALQEMYGADYSINDGDTTYTWAPSSGDTMIDGDVAIDPGANRIFATIWDGGGEDTYDLSAYGADLDLDVDLRPGEESLFSEVQRANLGDGNSASGNIYNAMLHDGDSRSLIENATGGAGADSIVGNAADNELRGNGGADSLDGLAGDDALFGAAGDDNLRGGEGDDRLVGGDGKDIAVFDDVRSAYTITAIDDTTFEVTDDETFFEKDEGTDRLFDVEFAKFADGIVPLGDTTTGAIDFTFLQDLTGSFIDDLPNVQDAARGIAEVIRGLSPDSEFAAAWFKDLSDIGFDETTSYTPVLETTTSVDSVVSTIGDFTASGGGDFPEEQLTALLNAAEGDGLDYREGSERIVLMSTDADYQTGPEYASIPAVRDALVANNVTPIFAVTSRVETTYEDLVDTLGRGAVVNLTPDSENLTDAVRAAVSKVTGDDTGDFGSSGADTLSGADLIDSIFGLGGDDVIDGLGGGDALDGGAGDDVVNGGAGADTLRGGSGIDELDGGSGNDFLAGGSGSGSAAGSPSAESSHTGEVIDGGSGTDTASYSGSDAAVTVNLTSGFADGGHATGDTLISIENLTGSGLDDTLVGDAGANVLRGGGGADRLVGGAGGDTMVGGDGDDAYVVDVFADSVVENDGGGTDRILTGLSSYTLPENVERLDFTGRGDNTAAGNASDNILNGTAGNNTMLGAGGADLLQGRFGDDTMRGDAGDDRLIGAGGTDDVEGGVGNDLLLGGFGDDTLTGGSGFDRLVGQGSDDTMIGGDGDDLLVGGSGNDTLIGGLGRDRLIGNGGADTFEVRNIGEIGLGFGGQDRIFDFSSADGDRIDVSGIDAVAASGADDAFSLIDNFSGDAGEFVIREEGSTSTVAFDVTGDGSANGEIFVATTGLTQDDFVL